MPSTHSASIANRLDLSPRAVEAALSLFDEGATIPFVARYRKERTGGLDESELRSVRDLNEQLITIDSRKKTITSSLESRDLLTPELERAVLHADTLAELEDIYRPFKQKRKTRADAAREKGLGLLAEQLLTGTVHNPESEAEAYVSPEAGVPDTASALEGARDIMAEEISRDPDLRRFLRDRFISTARLTAKRKPSTDEEKPEVSRYRDYFSFEESVATAAPHRIQAVLRGERDEVLTVHARPDEARIVPLLERRCIRGSSKQAKQIALAVEDAYRRLIAPSLERELLSSLKQRADDAALAVFAENLRDLLLAPPMGPHRIMGVDPGFRTGCKVVCLDESGRLLEHTAIYPLEPRRLEDEARRTLDELAKRHRIEVVAVGNGTGGREAETFLRAHLDPDIKVVSVPESGASVYSASEIAREEFPNHDVTVRGAVSIARRLIDPLAELVKIDPKSIGVGQYQHDVDQRRLADSLEETVVSCVNAVGVDLNTASPHLLRFVSGLGDTHAHAIVAHRSKIGGFSSRKQLLEIAGLGAKTFEQAAGFLRVRDGEHPLDASAVHPERYALVERIAGDSGVSVETLIGDQNRVRALTLDRYVDDEVGLETLEDIRSELVRPGRDPRETFESIGFNDDVHDIEDLEPGMTLPGVVTNVTDFGAFVDIGVHRDGLIHISKLSDSYVSNPREIVRVGQRVEVSVEEVDTRRNRIGLRMAIKE